MHPFTTFIICQVIILVTFYIVTIVITWLIYTYFIRLERTVVTHFTTNAYHNSPSSPPLISQNTSFLAPPPETQISLNNRPYFPQQLTPQYQNTPIQFSVPTSYLDKIPFRPIHPLQPIANT